jgi:D-alanyl-D-alanine carboxypeptidase
MPVLVFASDHVNDDFHYEIPPPKVASDAFIIADVKSGTVLASKNAEKKYSMGALVYLLTVLTATDHINMNRQLSVDTAHLATATSSRLAGRDLVSAYALLFPLLMEHSREAAHTLVSYSGVSHFNSLIQEKMESLGMHDSVVVDAAESDPGNVSTPNDLFRLARHLYTNRGFVLNITAGKPVAYAYPQTDFANLNNANATTTPGFVGGILSAEVGNTGAALLLLKVQVRGVPREVALIALDSSDIETDLKELRTYVTTIYQLTPRE